MTWLFIKLSAGLHLPNTHSGTRRTPKSHHHNHQHHHPYPIPTPTQRTDCRGVGKVPQPKTTSQTPFAPSGLRSPCRCRCRRMLCTMCVTPKHNITHCNICTAYTTYESVYEYSLRNICTHKQCIMMIMLMLCDTAWFGQRNRICSEVADMFSGALLHSQAHSTARR